MGIEQDYRQIVEGAAIGELAPTVQLAVAGADRASFLQGLLTNDIQALKEGSGCYAAWLTPQGRMLTDMHVLESDGMILLDVPAAQADATAARLEQFLFSEDVKLGSLAGALATLWVHGPGAAPALERALDGASGLGDWPQYRHAHVAFAGESLVLARDRSVGGARLLRVPECRAARRAAWRRWSRRARGRLERTRLRRLASKRPTRSSAST